MSFCHCRFVMTFCHVRFRTGGVPLGTGGVRGVCEFARGVSRTAQCWTAQWGVCVLAQGGVRKRAFQSLSQSETGMGFAGRSVDIWRYPDMSIRLPKFWATTIGANHAQFLGSRCPSKCHTKTPNCANSFPTICRPQI